MDISVIIPVYNSELTIEKCLDSVLNQTIKNIEIIIINDGSSDKSLSIIRKYKEKYSNIIVSSGKNKGVSNARNKGIKLAKGKYIVFVDSDDYIESTLFEVLLNDIKKKNIGLVINSLYQDIYINNKNIYKIIGNEISTINIEKDSNSIIGLIENNSLNSIYSKIYISDIIKNNNILFDEYLSIQEDLKFNIEYLKYINNIYLDNKPLYHYVLSNSSSLTSKYLDSRRDDYNIVEKTIYNFFNDKKVNSKRLYYISIKNTWSSIINTFYNKDNKFKRRDKIKYIINNTNYSNIKKGNRRGIKYKVLKYILRTKNISLIYIFGFIMYFLRKKYFVVYK